MEEHKLRLLLYLKKLESKKENKERGLIMARLSQGRDLIQFSTRIYCAPALWSSRAGKLLGKSAEAEKINPQIDSFRLRVLKAYDSLKERGGLISLEYLKQKIIGRQLGGLMLLSYMEILLARYKGYSGKEFNREAHLNTISNLKKHLSYRNLGVDIRLETVSSTFLENFIEYLSLERRLSPNYVRSILSPLRRVWRELGEEYPEISSPFVGATIKIKKKIYDSPRYLSADEMQALSSLSLTGELKTARDMFIFACHSGMSFVDLSRLGMEQISRDNKGVLWLRYSRVNTGQDCSIPLLSGAVTILRSYGGDKTYGLVFPKIQYQDYMTRLKALGLMIGLSSPLTSHVARHTFATLLTLEQGVSIESVSRMLGHSSIQMTERYAHVTPQKVFAEFARFESYVQEIGI